MKYVHQDSMYAKTPQFFNCENCGKYIEKKAVNQKYCSLCNGLVSRKKDKERKSKKNVKA